MPDSAPPPSLLPGAAPTLAYKQDRDQPPEKRSGDGAAAAGGGSGGSGSGSGAQRETSGTAERAPAWAAPLFEASEQLLKATKQLQRASARQDAGMSSLLEAVVRNMPHAARRPVVARSVAELVQLFGLPQADLAPAHDALAQVSARPLRRPRRSWCARSSALPCLARLHLPCCACAAGPCAARVPRPAVADVCCRQMQGALAWPRRHAGGCPIAAAVHR